MKKYALIVAMCGLLFMPSVGQGVYVDLGAYMPGTYVDAPAYSPYSASVWRTVDTQPTGSGVYQPFLTFQDTGDEEGLNTDYGDKIYDNLRTSTTYVRAVQWSELGTALYGGDPYYSFTFDINEAASGADRFLSFDELRLFSGTTNMASSTVGLSLQWDMGTTTHILTDYTMASSGSGNDDIEVLIPYFAPMGGDWMYLYVKAGVVGEDPSFPGKDYGSNAGYEEVRMLPGGTIVPEPTTLLLLGLGLVGLAGLRRKKS